MVFNMTLTIRDVYDSHLNTHLFQHTSMCMTFLSEVALD